MLLSSTVNLIFLPIMIVMLFLRTLSCDDGYDSGQPIITNVVLAKPPRDPKWCHDQDDCSWQHDHQAKVNKTRRVPLLLPPKSNWDWPSGRDVQTFAPTFIRMRHSSYTTTSAIHHDAPSCCMMMLVRSKTLFLVCRRSWRNLQHHIRYWLHCRPSWKQQVATAATVFSFFFLFPFFLPQQKNNFFGCCGRKIVFWLTGL